MIGLDQWTKYLLRSSLADGGVWYPWPWLSPYIQIIHAQNSGAAFSMGQGMGWIFVLAAVAAVLGILAYIPHLPANDLLIRIFLGLVMGGAAGNLIDRLIFGHVTDFIAVSHFAIINVADICINLGVGVIILWLLRGELAGKRKPSDPIEPG